MTDRAREIQERLAPTHLTEPDTPSEAELREQVEGASVPEKPKPEEGPDPRGEKLYTFSIEYTDARGKEWKGQFTSKILSIHERSQVGATRAMLAGGQPTSSVDPLTAELNLCVAHMTWSLVKRPDWAENLRALEDPALLQAIFAEVDSHESYFLGWLPVEKPSSEKSE